MNRQKGLELGFKRSTGFSSNSERTCVIFTPVVDISLSVYADLAMVCCQHVGCRTWSLFLLLLGGALVRMSSLSLNAAAVPSTSTQSASTADHDTFMFTQPGISLVEFIQPPMPPPGPEVGGGHVDGHVVGVELEFRTIVDSALLLHRDPRRDVINRKVIDSTPKTATRRRHVTTGCTREVELRVQLKIGRLHVSAMYDDEHVACVTVGQGKCLTH